MSRVAATLRAKFTPVILAGRTMSLFSFQGVHPVAHSISPSMALESCALNAGSLNGFPTGLVWAGGIPPLPLLPLPPHPRSGSLGNMVACMLHPREGTLQCTDVD